MVPRSVRFVADAPDHGSATFAAQLLAGLRAVVQALVTHRAVPSLGVRVHVGDRIGRRVEHRYRSGGRKAPRNLTRDALTHAPRGGA
jgi:hypothetical protein